MGRAGPTATSGWVSSFSSTATAFRRTAGLLWQPKGQGGRAAYRIMLGPLCSAGLIRASPCNRPQVVHARRSLKTVTLLRAAGSGGYARPTATIISLPSPSQEDTVGSAAPTSRMSPAHWFRRTRCPQPLLCPTSLGRQKGSRARCVLYHPAGPGS